MNMSANSMSKYVVDTFIHTIPAHTHMTCSCHTSCVHNERRRSRLQYVVCLGTADNGRTDC